MPWCVPIPIWQLTSHVQQDHPPCGGASLPSFCLSITRAPAYLQGHALWRKFLLATSSFFVLSLLIKHSDYSTFQWMLPVIIMVVLYYSVTQPLAALQNIEYPSSSLMHHNWFSLSKDHMEYSYTLTRYCYQWLHLFNGFFLW